MKSDSVLLETMALFLGLSFLSVGGTVSLLPELHRFLVDARGVMNHVQFANYVALAQAAPGPNILYIALFGYHIAGFIGAVACLLSMSMGPVVLILITARVDEKFRTHPWREIALRGLAPVSVGLLLAGMWTLTKSFGDWRPWVMCLVSFGVFLNTKIHPLWMFAIGAALAVMIGL
jgi:chromate transporter